MAVRNIQDLTEGLFKMFDRLGDDDLMESGEILEQESRRAKMMCKVAGQVLEVARLQATVIRLSENSAIPGEQLPPLISFKEENARNWRRKELPEARR